MKDLITRNFNILMLLSVGIGLGVPGLELLPKSSAMILISTAIFFSCSRVTIDELRNIDLKSAFLFYVVRFLIVPIPIYYLALFFIPEYAMGVLLIALAPVGASATSVALLTRGNASLALSSTVVTNALAPFTMTFLIYCLSHDEINIDILSLFTALGLSIFMPAVLYFGVVRKIDKVKAVIRRDASFYSTICIAAMIAVVTALEKEYILNNLDSVLFMIVIGCVLFFLLYFVAWLFFIRMDSESQKTYMLCSGVNNTGISSGLALLYFSPAAILFTIVAEIPWTIGIILFKKYADRVHE
tara:strand:- start:201 stop:1100 length:900 start_codon:yes stop_codon:yes gene_type:complete